MHVLLLISKERTKLEKCIETWKILRDYATPPWRRESLSSTTFSLQLGSLSVCFCLFSNIKLIKRYRPFLVTLYLCFKTSPGARFSKLPVITGPVKLFCFLILDVTFKRFENFTVKFSAKETKWNLLGVRTHPTSLETLI